MGKHLQDSQLKQINGESLIGNGNIVLATNVDLNLKADKTYVNETFGKVKTVNDVLPDENGNVTIESGGSSPLLKKGTGNTTCYWLDGNVEPTNSLVTDLRINGTTQLGFGAVVLGGLSNNRASNSYDAVFGGNTNTASGGNSVVTGGQNNTASGQLSSVSGGRYNQSSGQYSTVSGGNSNRASGDYSTVTGGISNTAFNYSETVVGSYSTTGTAQTSRVDGDPIFRVGIGTATSNRKDGFIVTNEGNVELPEADTGITFTSPNGSKFKLTVGDDGQPIFTPL